MEEKNCINAGRPVYFSYARSSSRKPEWEHISDCMDTLLETFHEKNIEYRLDKRDIGTGDKISKYEEEIGWKSEVVVIVFSDKYFRSMHCMYEFVQIKRALEQYPEKRLMCIKSGNFNLSDVNYIMELERYWGNEEQDYKDIEYHRLREHYETERAAWQNGFYMADIRQLYSFFSSINYSNAQSIDYDNFTNDIIRYYKNTPEKPKLTPKPKITPQPTQRVTPKPAQKTKNNPQPQKDKNVEPKFKVKVEPQFVVRSAPQSPVYVKYKKPKKRRFLRFIFIVLLCFGFVYYGKEVKGYENISDFVAYLITELFEKFK